MLRESLRHYFVYYSERIRVCCCFSFVETNSFYEKMLWSWFISQLCELFTREIVFHVTFLTQNPFKIITRLKLSTELRRGDDLHFNMIAIFDVVVLRRCCALFYTKNILNPTIMPHWHVSTLSFPPYLSPFAIYYSYL